jgi:hypothetical protein
MRKMISTTARRRRRASHDPQHQRLCACADILARRCALNAPTVLAWATHHAIDVQRLAQELASKQAMPMDLFARFLDALLSDAPLPGYVIPPAP